VQSALAAKPLRLLALLSFGVSVRRPSASHRFAPLHPLTRRKKAPIRTLCEFGAFFAASGSHINTKYIKSKSV
jgi:hypothetical protein